MAAGPSQQLLGFTNDEKNFLLAELIKSAAPPYNVLLDIFNRLNTQPRLEEIPLPTGRSLNACRLALDEMRRGPMYSPLSSTGIAPTPLSAPIPPLKRSIGAEGPYSAGRALLPKTTGFAYAHPISEPPAKRKRGRPTKAEQQARAAEMAGSIEPSALPPRFNAPLSASGPASPVVDSASRQYSTLPPINRVPISTMITTPTAPKSASHSGSSSGKKRRRRKSEERNPVRDETVSSAPPAYGSSSYTRLPDLDETPARATASRTTRDDPIHSTVARLGISEPEQSSGAQRMTTGSPQSRGPQLPPPYYSKR